MGLQKDEDQVCPTSNYYHYLENKSYVRLLGGKCSDAYTRSKSGGVIKHGTDQKKMREAKQRGRQLTTGLRTPPYQLPAHPRSPKTPESSHQKSTSEVGFDVRAKAAFGYARRKLIFCQTQVSF